MLPPTVFLKIAKNCSPGSPLWEVQQAAQRKCFLVLLNTNHPKLYRSQTISAKQRKLISLRTGTIAAPYVAESHGSLTLKVGDHVEVVSSKIESGAPCDRFEWVLYGVCVCLCAHECVGAHAWNTD